MGRHKCSEESFKTCMKSNLCHLCDGERLFTEPKWVVRKRKEEERKKARLPRKKKEGMDFENSASKAYRETVYADRRKNSVSRRPGSGSIWSMPGDIITESELIECKERGTVSSKGVKTISISKEQLCKIKHEAYHANRDVWYYLFRYKGDTDIYLVKDYDDELAMLQQIQTLKKRIVELENKEDTEHEN